MNSRENVSVVIVGHVDHGKSTIVGRLLADSGSLPQGKLDLVKELCRRNAKPFEYAFLLDALKEEQAQGITIDTARCFFKTPKRDYTIIDAPGHLEFLKNMVTGASRAGAALMVIDADEGVQDNSRRHGYLLSLLGIKQVIVLVNKMDLVEYKEGRFQQVVQEYSDFLREIHVSPLCYLPVSGKNGDNIIERSSNLTWYEGNTVIEALDELASERLPTDKPFRLPVQGVYKFTNQADNRRIVAGTIETGTLHTGDEVIFYPSGKRGAVQTIEAFNRDLPASAEAGCAIGFTMREQIYVKRGEIVAIPGQVQPYTAKRLRVSLFWLGKQAMVRGKSYIFRLGTAKVQVRLEEVVRIVDASNLQTVRGDQLNKHDIAECIFQLDKPVAFDLASEITATSRFVIVDQYEISGGGIIREALEDPAEAHSGNISWQAGKVGYEDRCRLLSQQGLVVWFTGLSGSGKSTIAVELEKELLRRGILVYRLDGDNIRYGLCSDLGFSAQDRHENIRRITEVATLFQDTGVVTLVSFITPFQSMREQVRNRLGDDSLIEVYVKASIETCQIRDPKGLYRKALVGEIPDFTGMGSTFEEPENPDVIIDTEVFSVEQSVARVLQYVLERI